MTPQTTLYALFDNNGSFSDLTQKVNDWLRDSVTFDNTVAQDHLYLGRYKPFGALWFEMGTANVTAATMTVEYYDEDAVAWTAVTPFLEDTQGFTRSGWVKFSPPTTWGTVSVNSGTARYWIRLSFSATFVSSSTIQAIGVLFCDDQTLKTKLANFSQFLPTGETSLYKRHLAARDEIITKIKSQGYLKVDGVSGNPRPYNEWDLLEIDDIREAAKFKALAGLYFDLSSTQDDSYMDKYKEFNREYLDCMAGAQISLDQDEDGYESAGESASQVSQPRLYR